ncbi:hypothetical protein SSAG_00152 [Streptomyces sp. Mg1]|nr:hypothetical protein SSAG_00152 [Streptomyces sp. Mg1]
MRPVIGNTRRGRGRSCRYQSCVKDWATSLIPVSPSSWMNDVNSGLLHDDRPPHTVRPASRAAHLPVR